MSDEMCRSMEEQLDAYAVGLEGTQGLDRSHLERCPRCARAYRQARDLRALLDNYAREAEAASRGVEGELQRRLSRTRLRPRPAWKLLRGRGATFRLAALAAGLAVAAFGLRHWRSIESEPVQLERASQEAPESDLVGVLERKSQRRDILQYMDRSRLLLLTLLDSQRECLGPGISIDQEKTLARDLLYDKRLLDHSLKAPGREDFKRICDELEAVLFDVASSEACVHPSRIRLWRSMLESRSTLMRLSLLSREAAT